jgi:hypothetical protein
MSRSSWAPRSLLWLLLALASGGCGGSTPEPTTPFQLPPAVKAQRAYPRLVNYFHRMDFAEARIEGREEYLAQWDVIILNPQNAEDQGLDLARIRAANPSIKILAWIPYGQSSLDMELSTTMPDLSAYFVKTVAGQPLRWSWGGYYMNPYTGDPPGTADPGALYAWPKHVVSFVAARYLAGGTYDGVLFDCVWSFSPKHVARTSTADVDGNGVDDNGDELAYVTGNEHLLSGLRAAAPGAIITANPGDPWYAGASLYTNVNGVMMENALGDEWRPRAGLWDDQWGAYRRALGAAGAGPGYTFVAADVRYGRTDEAARTLSALTAEDLRRFRFALGMTLLGDGYFGFDRGDGNHGQLWWFPEYDVDLGQPAAGYEAPDTWRADVYGAGSLSREFENGTVIVNPTTAALHVTLGETRIDASTTSAGTSFEIPPSDARLLLREP